MDQQRVFSLLCAGLWGSEVGWRGERSLGMGVLEMEDGRLVGEVDVV